MILEICILDTNFVHNLQKNVDILTFRPFRNPNPRPEDHQ